MVIRGPIATPGRHSDVSQTDTVAVHVDNDRIPPRTLERVGEQAAPA